ncbi:MAG: 3-deoxy-8-phosphooctulonate synthase [SAR324 cluster bacterium]|nr:3-deoxy-8-phosphooctulonate synthase [SAR324 cluster bacterium]
MINKRKFSVGDIKLGGEQLFLIAGPCVIEDEKSTLLIAEKLKIVVDELKIPTIFKSSFQKDNRSSLQNYVGPGLKKGLNILSKVKQEFGFTLLSDIHCATQANEVAEVLDVIQIPAYLCMQSSLLQAAAKTGRCVNIKHGQFLAPKNMKYPLAKCVESGNDNIILTERGHSFGYNDLIVDPRAFYELNQLGYPVVFDITHSIRKYGVPSAKKEGGARHYIPLLARAGAAAGIDGVFIEVHHNPDAAKCDAASQLNVDNLKKLLEVINDFHKLEVKHRNNNGTIS